jgi:hypothetical protein
VVLAVSVRSAGADGTFAKVTVFEIESILSPISLKAETYSLSFMPRVSESNWKTFAEGSSSTSTESSTYSRYPRIENPPAYSGLSHFTVIELGLSYEST